MPRKWTWWSCCCSHRNSATTDTPVRFRWSSIPSTLPAEHKTAPYLLQWTGRSSDSPCSEIEHETWTWWANDRFHRWFRFWLCAPFFRSIRLNMIHAHIKLCLCIGRDWWVPSPLSPFLGIFCIMRVVDGFQLMVWMVMGLLLYFSFQNNYGWAFQ